MEDFTEFERPATQGGRWFLAQRIKIITLLLTRGRLRLDSNHAAFRPIND